MLYMMPRMDWVGALEHFEHTHDRVVHWAYILGKCDCKYCIEYTLYVYIYPTYMHVEIIVQNYLCQTGLVRHSKIAH